MAHSLILVVPAAFTGYVLGNLVGQPLLRDVARWLRAPAHSRPDWKDR